MGLLDVLNGMQHGPGGQRSPAPAGSGGMSPLTMAILGLLAYKAVKHLSGGQPSPVPSAPRGPGGATTAGMPGGGLGDLLPGGLGGLGGLLAGGAGGALGSVLTGGLNDLLKQFQQGGHGDVANSWVGKGPNKPISPDVLSKVLSDDQINMLTQQTGLSREELVNGLSAVLPQVVDYLTPEGRLPTEHEASRLVS